MAFRALVPAARISGGKHSSSKTKSKSKKRRKKHKKRSTKS